MLSLIFSILLSNPGPYIFQPYGCTKPAVCSGNIMYSSRALNQIYGGVLIDQEIRLCGIKKLKSPKKVEEQKAVLELILSSASRVTLFIQSKKNCIEKCLIKDSQNRWVGWIFADGQNLTDVLIKLGIAEPSNESCS